MRDFTSSSKTHAREATTVNEEYLEDQQEVIELIEERGYDVLKSSIEQYAVEDPCCATLELAIELVDDSDEDGSNPFRVK